MRTFVMKQSWTLSVGIALLLLLGGWAFVEDGHAVRADGWLPAQLNPFAKAPPPPPTPRPEAYLFNGPGPAPQPSPLEQIGAGTKKVVTDVGSGTVKLVNTVGSGTKKVITGAGAGTKKLITGARDVLPFAKPEPEPAAPQQVVPWMQDPNSSRYRQFTPEPPKEKRSWLGLGTLFRPAEPEYRPSKTWDDWWKSDRP